MIVTVFLQLETEKMDYGYHNRIKFVKTNERTSNYCLKMNY